MAWTEKVVETLEIDGFKARWVYFIRENGSVGRHRWLIVTDAEGIEQDNYSDKGVIEKFIEAKQASIRSEYSHDLAEGNLVDVARDIIQRSWDGEWVGQRNDSMLYVQVLAEIMELSVYDTMSVIHKLNKLKIVDLNGMIIITHAEGEASRAWGEKEYGHKNLSLSDFGGWKCWHCGAYADEYGPSPKELPCID